MLCHKCCHVDKKKGSLVGKGGEEEVMCHFAEFPHDNYLDIFCADSGFLQGDLMPME